MAGHGAVAQTIVKGRMELTSSILENGPIKLSGEWFFYWDKLLKSDEIDQHAAEWIRVPGSWDNNKKYPVLGHATYRLLLTLPENENNLSLYVPIVNASAKIWINGKLMDETGHVSADKKSYEPKLMGTIVALPDQARNLDIIIQVANYSYFSSGLVTSPVLGKTSALFSQINRTNGIENFFAGSLVAMFIYQLILYFLFHRGKPYLWLGLICLGVALRALIVHGGSFLLPSLYPSVNWEYWKKVEFASVYGIVALFPLYVYHLFPENAPRKPIYFFVGLAGVLLAVVLVTPQYTYGQLLEVSHFGLLAAFVYAVYSISKAWRVGNQDAKIILIGVLVSFPFILTEILQNTKLIEVNFQFMYLVELGVLVFLLFQVYLLANHYAQSYRNLEQMNISLESVVKERTSELTTANTVKDRLLSVMSHDIKSPLNSLRGILQLYNKEVITKEEFGHFTMRIENDLSKTNILVENILYWTASQLKGVRVKSERFDLNLLIEENIHLFQTIAASKGIQFNYHSSPNLWITSDRDILNFTVRNLIANAIKFSFEGGTIDILINITSKKAVIQVKDYGIGMDELTLQSLLQPELVVSSSGTRNEKGSGLGIVLCREYLQKAGGMLTIKSAQEKGSTFSIVVPLG